LDKFKSIIKAKEEQEKEDAGPKILSNMDQLDYTPVNEETFSAWCTEFMAKLRIEEEN